jgi:hypothetical protein
MIHQTVAHPFIISVKESYFGGNGRFHKIEEYGGKENLQEVLRVRR